MKAIHYDAEGDILSVTFTEKRDQKQRGIELSDNLVLYYNPDNDEPLQLIIISYQALLEASATTPIALDGLTDAPAHIQSKVIALLERAPLTAFLQLVKQNSNASFASHLHAVFTPMTLQMVAAG